MCLVACVDGSDDVTGTSGGGKADEFADAGPDGAEVARRSFTGSCTETTTEFRNGYGRPSTSTERIDLSIAMGEITEAGDARGTVRVESPWGSIPAGLWRGWCHIARQDFAPLGSPCTVGPFEISTTALGFGGGYVWFRRADDAGGFDLGLSAQLEEGRDSYYDDSYTRVRYFCQLR